MNLVSTMLVYMSLLMSASLQQASDAAPRPTEFVTPAPMETAAPYVAPTAAPTVAAPAATQTPAAPAQVILGTGSRGENVRVLQRRLIELGYLTGNADGVYGKNTRRAVERFQRANNLKADGVAGPKTLSKLYYDADVVPAKGHTVPTPTALVETAAPTAPVPQSARVPVSYTDEKGAVLFTETLTLPGGTTTYRADDSHVPEGYALTNTREVTVTVDTAGKASPSAILYVYAPPKVEQTPAATATAVAATAAPKQSAEPAATPAEKAAAESAAQPVEKATDAPTAKPTQRPTEEPQATEEPQPTEEPEETEEPAAQPTAAPYMVPSPVEGIMLEAFRVLTAPQQEAYQVGAEAEDGASVRIYGKTGEWVMVGFVADGNLSVGYVPLAAVASDKPLAELAFMEEENALQAETALTDTPDAGTHVMAALPEGGKVRLLGLMNSWAYVETTVEGQTARGFIDKGAVGR